MKTLNIALLLLLSVGGFALSKPDPVFLDVELHCMSHDREVKYGGKKITGRAVYVKGAVTGVQVSPSEIEGFDYCYVFLTHSTFVETDEVSDWFRGDYVTIAVEKDPARNRKMGNR